MVRTEDEKKKTKKKHYSSNHVLYLFFFFFFHIICTSSSKTICAGYSEIAAVFFSDSLPIITCLGHGALVLPHALFYIRTDLPVQTAVIPGNW